MVGEGYQVVGNLIHPCGEQDEKVGNDDTEPHEEFMLLRLHPPAHRSHLFLCQWLEGMAIFFLGRQSI